MKDTHEFCSITGVKEYLIKYHKLKRSKITIYFDTFGTRLKYIDKNTTHDYAIGPILGTLTKKDVDNFMKGIKFADVSPVS